jgi:hypothetical protein
MLAGILVKMTVEMQILAEMNSAEFEKLLLMWVEKLLVLVDKRLVVVLVLVETLDIVEILLVVMVVVVENMIDYNNLQTDLKTVEHSVAQQA